MTVGQLATRKSNYRQTDVLLTAFNGLLAGFTLALVIVGGRLARRLRETVELTKESADAAKEGARIARQALEISQRARISIESVHLAQDRRKIDYDLHNSGSVAATDIGVRVSVKATPKLKIPNGVDLLK